MFDDLNNRLQSDSASMDTSRGWAVYNTKTGSLNWTKDWNSVQSIINTPNSILRVYLPLNGESETTIIALLLARR